MLVAAGVRVHRARRLGVGVLALAALVGTISIAPTPAGTSRPSPRSSWSTALRRSSACACARAAGCTLGARLPRRVEVALRHRRQEQPRPAAAVELPTLRIAGVAQYDPMQAAARRRVSTAALAARRAGVDLEALVGVSAPSRTRRSGAPPQPPPDFHDTVVPRVAVEASGAGACRARGARPATSSSGARRAPGRVLLDADRHVLTVGAGFTCRAGWRRCSSTGSRSGTTLARTRASSGDFASFGLSLRGRPVRRAARSRRRSSRFCCAYCRAARRERGARQSQSTRSAFGSRARGHGRRGHRRAATTRRPTTTTRPAWCAGAICASISAIATRSRSSRMNGRDLGVDASRGFTDRAGRARPHRAVPLRLRRERCSCPISDSRACARCLRAAALRLLRQPHAAAVPRREPGDPDRARPVRRRRADVHVAHRRPPVPEGRVAVSDPDAELARHQRSMSTWWRCAIRRPASCGTRRAWLAVGVSYRHSFLARARSGSSASTATSAIRGCRRSCRTATLAARSMSTDLFQPWQLTGGVALRLTQRSLVDLRPDVRALERVPGAGVAI